jgi:hypothetical protein
LKSPEHRPSRGWACVAAHDFHLPVAAVGPSQVIRRPREFAQEAFAWVIMARKFAACQTVRRNWGKISKFSRIGSGRNTRLPFAFAPPLYDEALPGATSRSGLLPVRYHISPPQIAAHCGHLDRAAPVALKTLMRPTAIELIPFTRGAK